MENELSQLDPGKYIPMTPADSASSEPRKLTKVDVERILGEAQDRQKNWGGFFGLSEDKGPIPSLAELVQQDYLDRHNVDPEQAERLLQAARDIQGKTDARKRSVAQERLQGHVGRRFAEVTLDGYKISNSDQGKVVAAIRGYADTIRERVAQGQSIVLFGGVGTGKTHLLAVVAKAAILADFTVEWTNGQDLFASFRDAIERGTPEQNIIDDLVKADLLVLDDLLPPGGKLTDYQATNLYRIVDGRYRDCKATLVSMNVASGQEAASSAGAQSIDRLRHGALSLFCNWPSYRKETK